MEAPDSCFDAFSSREHVPTSLENALAEFEASSISRAIPAGITG
jgi:hypothetical protein